MKMRIMLLLLLLPFILRLSAMNPIYHDIEKGHNEVSAIREDGALVAMRFNPEVNLYTGYISFIGIPQPVGGRGNIIYLEGSAARQVYEYLMNFMEIE